MSNVRSKRLRHIILQGLLLLAISPFLYTISTLQHSSAWRTTTLAEKSSFAALHSEKINGAIYSRSPIIPLRDLVDTNVESSCPEGLLLVNDTILDDFPLDDSARRIPRRIHMTSKTRCMPKEFVDIIDQWRFPGYELYFHNDAAMQKLFNRDWPEFPQLKQVLRCTKGGAGLADVWRALVMWEYGGIYTDIDNAPAKFNGKTIRKDDDAFFVIERSAHLSQYFFAARPRHPLFFLLVQHMMSRLLSLNDVNMQVVSLVTGPGATRVAFCNFMGGQGPNFPKNNPSSSCWYPEAKVYRGMNGYKVRAVGHQDESGEYVARDVLPDKNLIYKRMNMTYFRDLPKTETKESCIQRIYNTDWNAEHAQM